MPKIECYQHIEDFHPSDVFDAGTLSKNLPKGVPGFKLILPDERIEYNSMLSLAVRIANNNYELDAYVTDFLEEERVLIEGEDDDIGNAALELELQEHEEGGTHVRYALKIDYGKKVPFYAKPLIKPALGVIVSKYAGIYTSNVIEDLSQRAVLLDQ